MMDQTYTQVRRELSKNVVIKGSKIVSYGTEEQKLERQNYRRKFTYAAKHNGVPIIGVKLGVEVLEETFSPYVSLQFLDEQDGQITQHTDPNLATTEQVLAFARIKNAATNWSKDGNLAFSTLFHGYEAESYAEHY